MTAAETGYFGVIALVVLLLPIITNSFICGWQNSSDPRSEVLFGFGVAALVVCIHSYFEFAILTIEIQYLFVMTIGVIAGLTQQLGYRRRGYVRKSRPGWLYTKHLRWRYRRGRSRTLGRTAPINSARANR